MTESAVADSSMGPDHAALADDRLSFKRHMGTEDRVLPDLHVRVDPGRRGILEGDPRLHPVSTELLSHDPLRSRKLFAGINAQSFFRLPGRYRCHPEPSLHGQRHNIGQIVFLLGVLRLQPLQRLEQERTIHDIGSDIDFLDARLGVGRVTVLHDSEHHPSLSCASTAGLFPHDTSVSGRIVQDSGQHGHSRPFSFVQPDKIPNG